MKNIIVVIFLVLIFVGCKDNSSSLDNTNTAKSVTFTVYNTNWELSSGMAVYQKFVPEITKRILDNGIVLVYINTGDNVWTIWDKTVTDLSEGYSFVFSTYLSLTRVNLVIMADGTEGLPKLIESTQKFKVVMLDGYPTMLKPTKEEFSDYKKLEKLYNIENKDL